MPYKYDLFISHSTKNKDIADYLVKRIEERGYKCFIAPRDINLASEYPVELENGIIKSLAFLLIFSHDADVSRHVRTEIDIAFSINKTIIPFRIENILPSKSLAYYLRLPQWLDAFPKILDVHLEEIIKKIKALKDVEIAEDQEQNFKIVGPQLLNSEDISELGLDYKSLLMKKIEIDNICVPTADTEKYSEKLHNLQQNLEVENSVLLIKNDEIIGYCDLCPVTKDTYNELVIGKTLLQENMVEVCFSGDTIDICIPMLAILPTHSKSDNYLLIFEWIFQKFLSWYEDEITINRICISVYSPTLDKIVRKFGFIEQSLNPLNGKIYSTSLAELKENNSVGKGKKYKRFFESIIVPEETKINVNNNANSKISEEKNSTIKPSEANKTTNEKVFNSETVIKIPNEKESVSAPPNAIIPEPKLDEQPISIAPSKITNENISSENPSPLEITEKVQENESSSSVIKTLPTNKSEQANGHYDLFISYSSKNRHIVDYVVGKIETRGYKCFIAHRNIEPTFTSNFDTEIISGIENSSAILVILSSDSSQSVYIEQEVDSAITRHKFIIPLQIESFIPSKAMRFYVGDIQWIEATSGIQDIHIDKIIELLECAKQINSALKVSSDSAIEKAAKSGDPYAMLKLGRMYYDGEGIAKDKAQAFIWYKKSAEAGNIDAMRLVGHMYKAGIGVNKNTAQAVEWLKKAAEAGNIDAMFSLGDIYTFIDGIQSFLWYKKAAEAGNIRSIHMVGLKYQYGYGVDQDIAQSFLWYKKAAENGHPGAMVELGNMYYCKGNPYYDGEGIEKDKTQAFLWYKKAAETGSVSCMLQVADMYYKGDGVDINKTQAFLWYKKAADTGNTDAMCKLGDLYYYGEGVDKDKPQAIWWYEKAADKGSTKAANKLSTINKGGNKFLNTLSQIWKNLLD